MITLFSLVLVGLGLAVGFVLAWIFKVGVTLNLFVGLLLIVAGATVGFVVEWLIDEAYRKNRELRRQLSQGGVTALALGAGGGGSPNGESASETLADFLRRRDQEVRDLREELAGASSRMDRLRDEFEAYQRTHPDDLTVIKGVGPVYQWKLRDAGVNTWDQLAKSDPDQLRRMLDIKNWQRVNIESWIAQARDWAQRES